MQKKNNEEIEVSFVVSNPNTNGQNSENKNQSSAHQKVLGFLYRYFGVCVRAVVCMLVVLLVFGVMRVSIENYKLMNGMGINPIETVFLGLIGVVVGIVEIVVPMVLFMLLMGIILRKRVTGKMPKILPNDVKVALLLGVCSGVWLGGYFYRAFVTAGHGINMVLVRTSGQVGLLVFLVIFFVLLSLFNLCNIGMENGKPQMKK